VKLELLAGVFHRLKENKTDKAQQTTPTQKQNQQTQGNKQKRAGENPRKSGETCAPPKASHLISSTL